MARVGNQRGTRVCQIAYLFNRSSSEASFIHTRYGVWIERFNKESSFSTSIILLGEIHWFGVGIYLARFRFSLKKPILPTNENMALLNNFNF